MISGKEQASHFLRSLSFLPLAVRLWACRSWAVARLLLNKLWSSSKSFFFSSKAAFSSAWRRFSCSKRLCSWKRQRLTSYSDASSRPVGSKMRAGTASASTSTSTHLPLSVLQLSFLLLYPLNKHLPHLVLPLLQLHQELLSLGLVRLLQTVEAKFKPNHQRSSVAHPHPHCVSAGGSPDWFALWSRVFESHFFQLATSVQLIVARVSLLSQVLHVHADQHFPQFHKVTVVLVFH